jgi:hypothetical protein
METLMYLFWKNPQYSPHLPTLRPSYIEKNTEYNYIGQQQQQQQRKHERGLNVPSPKSRYTARPVSHADNFSRINEIILIGVPTTSFVSTAGGKEVGVSGLRPGSKQLWYDGGYIWRYK